MEYCNFVKYFYFILLLIFFTAILLRLASNGERVTEIQSVDDSAIVAFCEHDCNSSTTRSSSGIYNNFSFFRENAWKFSIISQNF